VADGVFFAELNELLTRELAEDGYSGVEVRVTPMRTEIIIRATRTQNVLGNFLSPFFTPASGTILLCCIHFNQELLFCGCNCCLSDNIEVLCRRKGPQDSGIDLSGAEKVQLP
jgi:hypothetical protein